MKIVKRILLVLFAAAIVAALVVASLPKPAQVDVAEVVRGDLRVTVDGDGKTRVQDNYVIAAPLYGNLARIELDPGTT
jgi:HlyD family secretion protein